MLQTFRDQRGNLCVYMLCKIWGFLHNLPHFLWWLWEKIIVQEMRLCNRMLTPFYLTPSPAGSPPSPSSQNHDIIILHTTWILNHHDHTLEITATICIVPSFNSCLSVQLRALLTVWYGTFSNGYQHGTILMVCSPSSHLLFIQKRGHYLCFYLRIFGLHLGFVGVRVQIFLTINFKDWICYFQTVLT